MGVVHSLSTTQNDGKTGMIFDIQRYSLHDGPGIRTMVFFKGCPLRCLWCSNPESQSSNPELAYFYNRCVLCEECIKNCPKEAISRVGDRIAIDRMLCDVCGICALKCRSRALQIVGEAKTVETLIDEIIKDRIFYRSSGGGVTLSGGEPTMQPDFMLTLIEKCQAESLEVTLETCGFTDNDLIKLIGDSVNVILYDLKHMNSKEHTRLTGISNEKILENAIILANCQANIIIRVPLIPGYNDSLQNLRETAEFVYEIGLKQVHLLPYHRLGESKYQALGREYPARKVIIPEPKKLLMATKPFKKLGLEVNITGF